MSRTLTSAPASRPSTPWGTSSIASARMKELTTPAPRPSGEAVSSPPTSPRRTRTNSRYLSPETRLRPSRARVSGASPPGVTPV